MHNSQYVLVTHMHGQNQAIDQRSLEYRIANPIWRWGDFPRPLVTPTKKFKGYSLRSIFEVMRRIGYLSYLHTLLAKIKSHDIYYVLPEYQEIFRKLAKEQQRQIFTRLSARDNNLYDTTVKTSSGHQQAIAVKIKPQDITEYHKPNCYYLSTTLGTINRSYEIMGLKIPYQYDNHEYIISLTDIELYGEIPHPLVHDCVSNTLLKKQEDYFANSYLTTVMDFIDFIKPLKTHLYSITPIDVFFHCVRFLQSCEHKILVLFNDEELSTNLINCNFVNKQPYSVIWNNRASERKYILGFDNLDDYLEFKLSTQQSQYLDLTDFMRFIK